MKQYSVTLWLRVSALKQHDVYRLCSRLSGSRLNDVIVNRILTSRPWPMMKIMAVTSGRDVSSCNKRIKLAVVGDKHVGKTSLISRYVYNSFSQHYTYTQGGDLKRLNMTINNNRVDVTLVDTAGHKYVRSLIKTLYRDVQGILVVFDVTRENTFRSVQEWLKQIELVNTNCPVIFLVGNKQDLTSHRCVPHEEATMQSHRLGVPYYETSARTGHNVHETFADLFRAAWQHSIPRHMPVEHISLVHDDVLKKTNNDSCCSIT